MLRNGNVTFRLVLVVAALKSINLAAPRAALAQTSAKTDAAPENTIPAVVSDGTKLDFYGDPIPQGALLRMGTVRLRHTSPVNGVTFSPEGKTIASAGWDHAIRLWDAETGKLIRQLLGSVDCGTFGVAFSPDGTRLASVGEQGLVRLWDPSTGKEIWNARTKVEQIYGVAFAPDGKTFATAGDEWKVRVWDVATAKQLATFDSPTTIRDFHGVAFSPDGILLACAATKQIQIYNRDGPGKQLIKINAKDDDRVFSLMFTPDSKSIVSGGRIPSLWRADTGELMRTFSDPSDDSSSVVALSQDGSLLATVIRSKIRVWKVETGEVVTTISDYDNPLVPRNHSAAISPDNKTVAVVSPTNTVFLWDTQTGRSKLSFSESHQEVVEAVACSPNGSVVASGSHGGDVRLWNLESGKQLRVLQLGDKRPRAVHDIEFSPDGACVAAGGYDWQNHGNTGIVNVWRVADGKLLWTSTVSGRVMSLSYSTDGNVLAAAAGLNNAVLGPRGTKARELNFLESASGKIKSVWYGASSDVCDMGFSADSSEVTVVEAGKHVTVWNLNDPNKAKQFSVDANNHEIKSAAISPDGHLLVTSARHENLVVVWNAKTGDGIRQIEVEGGMGSILAISPDGNLLASGSIDFTNTNGRYHRSIQLWSLETGECLGNVDTKLVATASLTFTPDNQKLISGMNDGTLLVWDVKQLAAMAN